MNSGCCDSKQSDLLNLEEEGVEGALCFQNFKVEDWECTDRHQGTQNSQTIGKTGIQTTTKNVTGVFKAAQ